MVILATGAPAAATGAVFQVTVDSAQLELTAARKSPPMGELSLVVLPTVSRSLAEAMVGQLVRHPCRTHGELDQEVVDGAAVDGNAVARSERGGWGRRVNGRVVRGGEGQGSGAATSRRGGVGGATL